MSKTIAELARRAALDGTELAEVSQGSATVRVRGTDISADGDSNSFSKVGSEFFLAGFTVGDEVGVFGFDSEANNIQFGVIGAITPGAITIDAPAGDSIITEAAGNDVLIVKWESKSIVIGSDDATDLGTVSTAQNVDIGTASTFQFDLAASVPFTFTNLPIFGRAREVRFIVTDTGGFNVSWPGEVTWLGNVVPEQNVSATEIWVFTFIDGQIIGRKEGSGGTVTAGGGGGGGNAVLPVVVNNAGTAYNVLADDMGDYIRFTSADPKAVTVQEEATEALPDDGEWHFRNAGAGVLVIDGAGSVVINAPSGGSLVLQQNMTVTLKRVAEDVFDVFGQTVQSA